MVTECKLRDKKERMYVHGPEIEGSVDLFSPKYIQIDKAKNNSRGFQF
jgi:hypothetical protein